MPSTEMESLVTAVVDGQSIGVFDTRQGGDNVGTEVKHRPGGMGPEKTYVSLSSPTTVTISRVFENARDFELFRRLQAIAGRNRPGSVTEQPLDGDGNAYGQPLTYSGGFLGVKWGNVDSNSSTARMAELDFSIQTIA